LRWQAAGDDIGGFMTWSGPDGMVVFMQDGARTLWLIAPDTSTAEAMLTVLR
jgi:hypothetical protein